MEGGVRSVWFGTEGKGKGGRTDDTSGVPREGEVEVGVRSSD